MKDNHIKSIIKKYSFWGLYWITISSIFLTIILFSNDSADPRKEYVLGLIFIVSIITVSLLILVVGVSLSVNYLKNRVNTKNIVKLQNPPGAFLFKLSRVLPIKMSRKLDEELSDMRLEYYEAIAEKNFWQARGLVVSYYVGLFWSVLVWGSNRIKELIKIAPK